MQLTAMKANGPNPNAMKKQRLYLVTGVFQSGGAANVPSTRQRLTQSPCLNVIPSGQPVACTPPGHMKPFTPRAMSHASSVMAS